MGIGLPCGPVWQLSKSPKRLSLKIIPHRSSRWIFKVSHSCCYLNYRFQCSDMFSELTPFSVVNSRRCLAAKRFNILLPSIIQVLTDFTVSSGVHRRTWADIWFNTNSTILTAWTTILPFTLSTTESQGALTAAIFQARPTIQTSAPSFAS